MVSKILQKLSLKGFQYTSLYAVSLSRVFGSRPFRVAQYTALYIASGAGATALAFVFDLNRISFFVGLLFAPFYVALFYVSALFIFKRKRQKLGYALLFAKQALFLLVCVLLYWLGEARARAFLVGVSAILPLFVFWLLSQRKTKKV